MSQNSVGDVVSSALPPHPSEVFDDYARQDILPKLKSFCVKYKRAIVVFGVYKKSSLKSENRLKHREEIR